jgi:hypothetical protein
MLLVRQEMLFIRALKSCLRPPASHIVRVSLVIVTSVPRSPCPVLPALSAKADAMMAAPFRTEETRWWLHPERRRCLAPHGGTAAMNCPLPATTLPVKCSLLPLPSRNGFQVEILHPPISQSQASRWPPPAHPILG